MLYLLSVVMSFVAFCICKLYMYCIWNYIVDFTTISPLGPIKVHSIQSNLCGACLNILNLSVTLC